MLMRLVKILESFKISKKRKVGKTWMAIFKLQYTIASIKYYPNKARDNKMDHRLKEELQTSQTLRVKVLMDKMD